MSGYDLHRRLIALDVHCDVIAPALTPRRPGQRIKTDRRDAAKLVRLYRAGELTAVHVPDESEEAVRDLLRCRDDIREDVVRWRHRLVKFLFRHGHVYRTGTHWRQAHWTWVRAQRFELPALQRTFEAILFAVEQAQARLADLDRELEAIAEHPPYREPVGWLRCFRGIDTVGAMVLLAEIVDFHRFHTPRELMAYLGLVPREYSSGPTERRGAITKAGNTHVRRILGEAAWHYRHGPRLGRAIALRIRNQPPEVVKRWLDCWRGVGVIAAGMRRHGYDLHLSCNREGWRATFLLRHLQPSLPGQIRRKPTTCGMACAPPRRAALDLTREDLSLL